MLVGLGSGLLALLAGLGVLLGGCAEGCGGIGILAQIALAAGVVALIAGAGWAGFVATRHSWARLGLWLLAMLVLAWLAEFVLTRL